MQNQSARYALHARPRVHEKVVPMPKLLAHKSNQRAAEPENHIWKQLNINLMFPKTKRLS